MLPTIKTKIKNVAKGWTDDEMFRFRNDVLWTGKTSYGLNHFRETNTCLCKVITT